MKMLLTTMALLTVIGTPSFAQSYDPDEGTGNIVPFVYGSEGWGARAQARGTVGSRKSSRYMRSTEGNIFGTDPDPNGRRDLRRNQPVQ
jgi:hypothetical protein